MANILFILQQDYRDEEFTVPYQIIQAEGHNVDVAGLQEGVAVGADGHRHEPNKLLSKITDFDVYDALVIPGGPGSTTHLWGKENIIALIKQFHDNHKVVAAICYGVIPVVQSGILQNRHATVYPTSQAKEILEEYGVRFSKAGCVSLADHKIITAQGPKFAAAFGTAILDLLK